MPSRGIPAHFRYAPRRVECAEHGVVVEHIPWSAGKLVTMAMMGFLASWARRLSWRETATAFQATWKSPCSFTSSSSGRKRCGPRLSWKPTMIRSACQSVTLSIRASRISPNVIRMLVLTLPPRWISAPLLLLPPRCFKAPSSYGYKPETEFNIFTEVLIGKRTQAATGSVNVYGDEAGFQWNTADDRRLQQRFKGPHISVLPGDSAQ